MASKWIFNYEALDGSGELCEMDARAYAPYFLEFRGKQFAYRDREFQREAGSLGGISGFYDEMQRTFCPQPPQEPETPPAQTEQQFGQWTVQSALEAAARMSDEELTARCNLDANFRAALDAGRPAEVIVDRKPNNASNDVAAWTRIREARVKRYVDSLKPLPDDTPRLSGEELYFSSPGFPPAPSEPKPEPVPTIGYTKLVVRK
jgi:hypothetical protein